MPLVIIPARHASTRYPGKPLVPLRGRDGTVKTLLQRSFEAASRADGIDRVVVATDDGRIADAARGFGAEVVMTAAACRNGSERCAEAAATLGVGAGDIVINFQGDALLTPPWFVEGLVAALRARPDLRVATPVLACDAAMWRDLVGERQAGRVGGTTAVVAADGTALYFSKEVVPFLGRPPAADGPVPVNLHVGVYAYRPAALADYAGWGECELERQEGLEQLRFLFHREPVLCVPSDARGRPLWELNNPADVARIEAML